MLIRHVCFFFVQVDRLSNWPMSAWLQQTNKFSIKCIDSHSDKHLIIQMLKRCAFDSLIFRVTARPTPDKRMVAISISDSGIGIPQDKLETIFKPFEQVDASIAKKYGGFGLGLNIARVRLKTHI